ncbi:hypothetical protein M1615_01545 [Patescibacteria group bacterium]|nr:hypothetical protein [Patescibacteria group bacterium]MCL5010271.1 hypothetical protein [Patescibacteria group bacterium]
MANIYDLKKKQKAFYKSIVSVFCPILNDTVYFTSEGFNHLLYDKSNRKPRKISEQFMKLQCLTHAPLVIRKCAFISETRLIERNIKGKKKLGVHYELVYEVKAGEKIRVIVEKIGTGKHKFLSVMRHNGRRKNKKHR